MNHYARLRMTVTGTVQGVGFRYFAVRAARRLGITGWVANRPDGSVEVVAEGEAGMLAEFASELRHGPAAAGVTGVRTQPEAYVAEFKDFNLKF
jgi:acylphosphatase